MITVEDRARAAMRAIAETVSDAPPLALGEAPRSRGSWLGGGLVPGRGGALPGSRRLGGWLAPLAAAVVVLVVAVSLVVVKQAGDRGVVTGPVPAVGGIPRYYVALDGVGSGNLVIGDTFTGKRLAVVHSPTSEAFSGIAAAADDRTFVVDTSANGAPNPGDPRTWYLLRLTPGTGRGYQLTRLPVPVLRNVTIDAVALSGSGTYLALGLERVNASGHTQRPGATSELRIYSVATGELVRSWSSAAQPSGAYLPDYSIFGSGAGMFGEQNRGLTWVDSDRAVVFPVSWLTIGRDRKTGRPVPGRTFLYTTMRRLDVGSGGVGLIAASRVIWTSKSSTLSEYPRGCQWGFNPLISADGKTINCLSVFGPPLDRTASPRQAVTWKLSWQAYSVAAPTVARDLYQITLRAPRSGPGSINQMWTDTTGGTVLVYFVLTGGSQGKGVHFGAVSGGRFRPLPVPPGLEVNGGPPSVTW